MFSLFSVGKRGESLVFKSNFDNRNHAVNVTKAYSRKCPKPVVLENTKGNSAVFYKGEFVGTDLKKVDDKLCKVDKHYTSIY